MSKYEKLAQHIREYLKTADTTTDEVGKVFEMLTILETGRAPAGFVDTEDEPTTRKYKRKPGSGKRGPLYKAMLTVGTGGTIKDIGNKARELGMRLPPEQAARDRSILTKLQKSPQVYAKNEDDTWRLLRLPTLHAV